jgi:HSP20 family protein
MSNIRLFDPGFNDSFDGALRRFFGPLALEADSTTTAPLKMRIDVSEKPETYLVKADIPGVKKEDIHVRIDGNVVQIDAEVRRETEEKGDGKRVLRSERYWGNISRTFSLAQDVDDGHSVAKYADGVLTLELPKKPAITSKKLTVQ